MDLEPRPRVLSFQSVASVAEDDSTWYPDTSNTRRFSETSTASSRRASNVTAGRKPAGRPPYRLLGKTLNDSIGKQSNELNVDGGRRSYENTYRTEPKNKFPEREVREIISRSLKSLLGDQSYCAHHCSFVTKALSSRILQQVKELNIERYKLVCVVNTGSKHNQGLRIASRCLWNADFDTHVSASVESDTHFAVATVYGVYFE